MFETVVIATDGSASAARAVEVALDFAGRFEAGVHAVYVIDETEIEATPDQVRDELAQALTTAGGKAVTDAREHAAEQGATEDIVTAVRSGEPAPEIINYAEECNADLLVSGTRGRHGDHAFLLGSVAEALVRRSPIPVLTVRQLEGDESRPQP